MVVTEIHIVVLFPTINQNKKKSLLAADINMSKKTSEKNPWPCLVDKSHP